MSESDPRLYNPNRDIAHCFGPVMMEVAGRLEDGKWKVLDDLLVEKGVSKDDLGKACEAFCKFVQSACDNKNEKMGECLERSGFWQVSELANVALCAYLGTVIAGIFWAGVREVTLGGRGPCNELSDLQAAGARSHALMTKTPFGRWWWRVKDRLRSIWAAVVGGSR
jgi:hypothetical protein